MDFPSLDRYLLEGRPAKDELVPELLREHPGGAAAAPFYEGMRILGPRTPDLSLIALRLVLAGKRAGDEAVKRLRSLSERARKGGEDAAEAAALYKEELR